MSHPDTPATAAPTPPPIPTSAVDQETYRQLVTAAAHRVVALAIEQGPLFAPYHVQAAVGQFLVTITTTVIKPDEPGKRQREWTPCERAILTVLETATERLTYRQIIDYMDQMGEIHGESTLRQALARLVRQGILASSRKAPQGYYVVATG